MGIVYHTQNLTYFNYEAHHLSVLYLTLKHVYISSKLKELSDDKTTAYVVKFMIFAKKNDIPPAFGYAKEFRHPGKHFCPNVLPLQYRG